MEQNLRTRREILTAGLAGGFSLLLASCGGATAQKAAAVKPAGSDLGAVEHVVFLMHENRSFDHYFGTYKGVRGFDDAQARSTGPSPRPGRAAPAPTGSSPSISTRPTSQAECTFDLSHEWTPSTSAGTTGRWTRFVATHTQSPAAKGPERASSPWATTRVRTSAFYYSLADAFTLCDGYHCSVIGPTHPNRLPPVGDARSRPERPGAR